MERACWSKRAHASPDLGEPLPVHWQESVDAASRTIESPDAGELASPSQPIALNPGVDGQLSRLARTCVERWSGGDDAPQTELTGAWVQAMSRYIIRVDGMLSAGLTSAFPSLDAICGEDIVVHGRLNGSSELGRVLRQLESRGVQVTEVHRISEREAGWKPPPPRSES